jgi:hypothetical protein
MRVDLESPILAISEGARARVTVDGCMGRYGSGLESDAVRARADLFESGVWCGGGSGLSDSLRVMPSP